MPDIKNVAIVGAGGNVGPSVLKAFLASPFTITVLSRPGSTSTFPSNVNVVRANYSSVTSLASALKGQDAVISLVGGEAIGDQNPLIDAAIAAGVRRFIPSEFGSNTTDARLLQLVPVFNGKKGTTDYLKSKEGEISWTSVINGPFFDWGLMVGFLGFDAKEKKVVLVDEGKGRFHATNLRRVGEALVKILLQAEETKNQYVFVSSVETSQAELLPLAQKVLGEDVKVENVTSGQLVEEGNQKIQKQDFSGIYDLIKAGAFGKDHLGLHPEGSLWNEKLGLEEESVEDAMRAAFEGKLYEK